MIFLNFCVIIKINSKNIKDWSIFDPTRKELSHGSCIHQFRSRRPRLAGFPRRSETERTEHHRFHGLLRERTMVIKLEDELSSENKIMRWDDWNCH